MTSIIRFAFVATCSCLVAAAGADIVRADGPTDRGFVGSPFGVGTAKFKFETPVRVTPGKRAYRLSEANGRLLYPSFSADGKRLLPDETRVINTLTVQFLFTGDDPLRVNLKTDRGESHQVPITPVQDADQHKVDLDNWWDNYIKTVERLTQSRHYSSAIDRSLVTMLGKRLKQERLPKYRNPWQRFGDWNRSFGLLVGTESIRMAMQQDTLLDGVKRKEVADRPLPKAVVPPPIQLPELPGGIVIEPIAEHVPPDCFYLRCGSFSNFLWLKDNVSKWGKHARDLMFTTGHNYNIAGTIERQLALKETALSRLFGDSVVGDVAIVGADPFVRAGSSVGVLFQAKKSNMLRNQIRSQRAATKAGHPSATESTIKLEGHDVAVLKSPDNRVRSFYVVYGDYHFVTNSRTLARDFLVACDGGRSLGTLKEFQYARHLMPLTREDTAFIYMSDEFFRRIVGVEYRVEMTRRMQAMADVELTELAIIAAKAEGRLHQTVPDLVDAGILPKHFMARTDGGHPIVLNGEVRDSLRGARGVFLPVADVDISKVTLSEQKEYEEFATQYRRLWTRMDPVTIGVQRKQLGGRKERIAFDIHITPYPQRHFGMLPRFLAKPNKQQMAPIKGNLVSMEVNFGNETLRLAQTKEKRTHARVFAGLQDMPLEFEIKNNEVKPTNFKDDQAPWYLGATPPITFLSEKDLTYDKDGYAETNDWIFGKHDHWLRQWDKFRVRAVSRELLEAVTPSMQEVEAEREAQIRLRVSDLTQTGFGLYINSWGYLESRKRSDGNVTLVHRLSEQFGLDLPTAQQAAEKLANGKLTCALGGEYEVAAGKNRLAEFRSTQWNNKYASNITGIPEDYRFPFMEWFSGLEIEFSIDATSIITHVEVDLSNQ